MDPLAAVIGAGLVVLAALITVWQARRRRATQEELRRVRAELSAERHAARHDHLTGLPNRRWFYGAGAALVAATDRPPLVAVLVDLDDFKRINDTFGHRAGDQVLVTVARRLADVVGVGLVARLGGDEFVALFDLPAGSSAAPAALTETAGRITEVLSAPMPVAGGWNVAVRASIGVVVAPPGSDLDEVLDRADAAMYRAKTARLASAPAGPVGRGESADAAGWFAADGRRRQVRAVAGDAVTWFAG